MLTLRATTATHHAGRIARRHGTDRGISLVMSVTND
jgi:hypothetical protein